jgi:DNA repair exonuclease SbcCD ATPase subunit
MGYRSYRGSSRGSSGRKFQKSQHEKAKTRTHKHRSKGAFSEEENTATVETITEKVRHNLKKLGEQKFAVSPFRQYFDDWLVNVELALSEFESSPAVKVDGELVKEREQILTKIKRELAQLKQEETTLEPCVKELADTNHLLVELDADYAAKTRETGGRRTDEMQKLTQKVSNLETELERVKAIKTSLFGGVSRKTKASKIEETTSKLTAAKAELENAVESFRVEQEKLHDVYEKKKQVTMERVQRLEKEIEKLETDKSLSARQAATEALAEAVKALIERQPKPQNASAE